MEEWFNKNQGELLKVIKKSMADFRIKTAQEEKQTESEEKSYLHMSEQNPRPRHATASYREAPPTPKLVEFGRATANMYQADELVDLYFYLNFIGNLGAIRRALIHDVCEGKHNAILNYNPHPTARAGIGQIICMKDKAKYVIDRIKEMGIEQLPESYVPLELSPISRHLGLRREKAREEHQIGVLRCWERGASSARNEAVVQLFDELIHKARAYLDLTEENEEEDSESDNEEDRIQPDTEMESDEPGAGNRNPGTGAQSQRGRAAGRGE